MRHQAKEWVTPQEAEAMIALRERLVSDRAGLPLPDVAAAMGIDTNEARNLLVQVRAEMGRLTKSDLAFLRRPPRLAITALLALVGGFVFLVIALNLFVR